GYRSRGVLRGRGSGFLNACWHRGTNRFLGIVLVAVPQPNRVPAIFLSFTRHFCTVCGTVFYPPFSGFPAVFPLLPPFFQCCRSLGLVLDGTEGGAAGGLVQIAASARVRFRRFA